MTDGLVGRADLLRALVAAPAADAVPIARLLGYDPEPPAEQRPRFEADGVNTAEQRPAAENLPESAALRPAVFWRPERYVLRETEPPLPVPASRPAWRNRPGGPPAPEFLAPWRDLAPRLRQLIGQALPVGEVDVDRVVDTWSKGDLLRRLPREYRPQPAVRVQVVVDRARHLRPFARDQALVAKALPWLAEDLAVEEAIWPSMASWPWLIDPGAGTQRPWEPPEPGSVVLALTDLGSLARHDVGARSRWRRLGEMIAAAGCEPAALLPCAPSRLEPATRRTWQVISWEDPCGAPPRTDGEGAEELIALLSHAIRIEPGLLRALRRAVLPGADAGVESEFWQHPALESDHPQAATLSPAAAARLQARLAERPGHDPDRLQTVIDLWRRWRYALREVVWFEEVLNLPPAMRCAVPKDDLDDARAHMAWKSAGGPGDDVVVREYFHRATRRATAHGWNTELATAMLRAKRRDDPAFRPPVPVDPRWEPDGEPARLDLWQRNGSVVAAPAGDPSGSEGSYLATLDTGKGRWIVLPLQDAFWAAGAPPAWAHDWGTDAYGAWAAFRVSDATGARAEQRMRWCPAGTFLMGSLKGEKSRFDDEGPQHSVTIADGFWMFDTACTEALWRAVMNKPPERPKGDKYPVTHVSWQDARAFVAALNARMPGLSLGLPTEAQWEYACRAGTTSAYSFGDTFDETKANIGATTVPVGSLPANPWGLHEMHGNVWEWCEDRWHDTYKGAPTDGSAWVDGGAASRVLRGGSGSIEARFVRSAFRYRSVPSNRDGLIGFRCARVQQASGAEQAAVPVVLASRGEGAERPRPQGPTSAAVLLRAGEAPASPPPRAGAILIRSDREELTFRSFTKPAWATDIGRDRFGLFTAFIVPGTEVTQRLRWIPPGRFWMGSPDDEPGRYEWEGPRHLVTLEEGFWLFDTPCTQALWQAVMRTNPSRFRTPLRPVENVSFEDALTFIQRTNQQLPGLNLVLPSEAQWEYACRAGTETATYAGPMEILGENNAPVLDAIAWYGGNSGKDFDLDNGYDSSGWQGKQYQHARAGTRPVGLKAANAWGLYDMLGNVWEWCGDDWHDSYKDAPTDGWARTEGAKGAANRVLRGGSGSLGARGVRSAVRSRNDPANRNGNVGFRCARVQRESEVPAVAEGGEEQASGAERAAATTGPERRRGILDRPRPERKRS